jgi:hypothetical protein
VSNNDVASSQFITTRDPRPNVAAVVDENREIKSRRKTARVAIAAGRLVDAA